MKIFQICRFLLFIPLMLTACSPDSGDNASLIKGSFEIKSPSFTNNSSIPKMYTCQGNNKSTPLTWNGAPDETKSFALIMDDPDARPVVGYTWIHWVAYNIPATVTKLPAALGTSAMVKLPGGESFTQGLTSWKKPGYGGPCPPKGTGVHRYIFMLYALKSEPNLPPGLTKEGLLNAIKGNILAEAKFIGTYTKD